MWIRSLGWEDPLEEGMATHSSILAWKIEWTEESGGLQSRGRHKESDTTEHTRTVWVIWWCSHSVMSDSLRPRGLKYARIPCPSPSPYSNSCPLSR